MRILFVNHWLGSFGGVEQNIAVTVDGLRARGRKCHLAFGGQTNKNPQAYAERFDSVEPCSDLGGASGRSLAVIARDLRPDVVYFHKADPLPPLEPLLDLGCRLVRMIHDHDVCCPRHHKYFVHNARVCHHPAGWRCWLDLGWLQARPGSLFRVGFRSLWAHHREKLRNRLMQRLLVGSRFMADELAMNGFPEGKISIVPPVVPESTTVLTPVPSSGPLLFVGQLIRGKGVDLLLKAMASMKFPAQLKIVGDGNARPALEKLTGELQLEDRVCFAGWVPPEQLGSIYASARAVVVPSRWPEPFGMIGLEAMRLGRPVAAFKVGGIPDWLLDEQTGLLSPEADTRHLAAQLDRLMTDSDLVQRLASQAAQWVQERFSFSAYLDQLEQELFPEELNT